MHLELQLICAPVAPFLEVRIKRSAEARYFRAGGVDLRIREIGVEQDTPLRSLPNLSRELESINGRRRTEQTALSGQQTVVEIFSLWNPLGAQTSKQAMEDHHEEVVHDRSGPRPEQTTLEVSVDIEEGHGRCVAEIARVDLHRLLEACGEGRDVAVQTTGTPD